LTEFTTTTTFITRHNSLPHVTILFNKLDETASTFNPMLSLFSRWGVRHRPRTNLPLLQISFQNLPGRCLTDSKAFTG